MQFDQTHAMYYTDETHELDSRFAKDSSAPTEEYEEAPARMMLLKKCFRLYDRSACDDGHRSQWLRRVR